MLVRDVAAQATAQTRRVLELGAGDEDVVVGEVVQAAGVVGVQVGITTQRTSPGRMPSPSSWGPISCPGSTHSRKARTPGCQSAAKP